MPVNPASSISSAGPTSPVPAVAAQVTSRPTSQPAATLRPDTVKLSLTAQIKLMRHQGVSPGTIASQMGISVKQLGNYISIASATASASSVALPAATAHVADSDDAAGKTGNTATSTPSGSKALPSDSASTDSSVVATRATAAAGTVSPQAVAATSAGLGPKAG